MRNLTDYMDCEGGDTTFLSQTDWDNHDDAYATQDFIDCVEKPIADFFMAHTKAELHEEAARRRFMLFPVNTPADLSHDHQHSSRDFWVEVEHPELGDTITYPGAFARVSDMSFQINRRAPLVGEHNLEIYEGELGLSRSEIISLKQGGFI